MKRWSLPAWLVVLGLGLLWGFPAEAAEPLARITVKAGARLRLNTPVSASLADLPEAVVRSGLRLEEITENGREAVPCQQVGEESLQLCWILKGRTPAAAKRVYELLPEKVDTEGPVGLEQDNQSIRILCGDQPVVEYHHAPVPPPPSASEKYTRSGFIHPLATPDGAVLTTIHPPDHIHHLGLWNPWTKTEFEGRHIDFWNLKKGEGTVRHVDFAWKMEGPVLAGFRAMKEHVDLTAPGGEKVALDEDLDVHVWGLPGTEDGYLLDYTITQRCASSSPLHLPPYRYGGLGFRATEFWKKNNSNYLTSKDKTRKNGHATRSRWCKAFGETPKGHAGVLFMSHPRNHEHPEPMRIWPWGPIFFNYCPIQKTEWTLKPGDDYVRRYRFYVYDGELSKEAAERLWQDFAHPPEVTVEPADDLTNRLSNPFFAFDNGVNRGKWSPDKQAEVLQDLGYEGISYNGPQQMPERLRAFRSRGLRVFSIYVQANLNKDPAYDPRLEEAISELKGSDTFLWLFVTGQKGADDERALETVREIADMAASADLKVALYPHHGMYVETVEDALRLVSRAGRDNLGVTFNLCHSLKAGNADRVEELLEKAMPHLYLVSINGASKRGDNWRDEGWGQLIQTLDRGEYDVAALLEKLQKLGYRGPIGLQCYNIKGDPMDNLRRSIKAWRSLSRQVASE